MPTDNIYQSIFSCKFCSKEFKNKISLSNHQTRCKENPERIENFGFNTKEAQIKAAQSRSKLDIQICEYCNKECKNKLSLSQHIKYCRQNPNYVYIPRKINENNRPGIKSNNLKNLKNSCRFCNNNFSKKKLAKHEIWCNLNPNLDKVKEFFKDNPKRMINHFSKAELLGLEKPVISDDTIKKLKKASTGKKHSEESKQKMSESIKKAILKNPESYTKSNRGRVKHIKKYNLTFDGNWELQFYEWCLKNNIKVEQNSKFFNYVYDKERLYNPDFYLPEFNIYIEVKGFYDDKDLAKWNCFPKNENLSIIFENEIKMIKNNTLTIDYILSNKFGTPGGN